MSSEYDQLVDGHPLYEKMIGHWTYLFNSYQGGERYQKAGYLTRYAYESEIDYQERLRQTPLDNHCKAIVSIYNAFLFRQGAERDYGSLENDPALEPFLKDADLEGRSLDAFMKDVSAYSSVFGHCWVMMAKPNTNANTRAEELGQGVRPYVSVITPMAVLDWRWERSMSGVYTLTYLKYIEDQEYKSHTVIKEWTPSEIITYQADSERQEIKNIAIEENGLGEIPAVLVYSARSIYRGIGISDIEDIADQQKAIYNELSEVEQAIRLNGHPSLVKTADVEATAGAGSIVQMPENLDPGLRPYMLDVSTDTNAIYQSIQQRVDSIDRMANTGSVRAKATRTLSGVAMEVEFSMLNSRLSEKADLLELAEEQMWRLFAKYQGTAWDGEINYPDSFSIRDEDRDYQHLKMVKETTENPQLVKAVDERLAELLGEELEEVDIIATDRTYPNGEAIDPRLPEAYQPASNEGVPPGQNCENCAAYDPQLFNCSIWGNAPVRPMYWCARWVGIDGSES